MARRAKPGQATPQIENDYGTPEARRNAFHVIEQPDPSDRGSRRVRVQDDVICWYERRGYLSTRQADALRRWQCDAYLSGLIAPCIGSYQQTIRGSREEISDVRLAAQTRRGHAIDMLRNHDRHAVQMVDAVAVDGKPAGRWIMEQLGGAPSEALAWLNRYTLALAKHYGI